MNHLSIKGVISYFKTENSKKKQVLSINQPSLGLAISKEI